MGAILLTLGPAVSARAAEEPEFQTRSYAVSEFTLEYALPHAQHPAVDELLALQIDLWRDRLGYRSPHAGMPQVSFPLGQVPPRSPRFFASALVHVGRVLVTEFNRRGIGGVIVTLPDLEDDTGKDLRPEGETRMRVQVWTGRASEVASYADGDRFSGLSAAERSNHPAHAWIRAGSPVQPGGERDLLRVGELEDYAHRLSRHPGRRTAVELAPGPEPGTTRVQLRVAEDKPWLAYAQLSNTGTSETTKLRERFGFTDNQLTGHDDVLRLDYVTGNFDSVHAFFGSYEAPLPVPRIGDLRGRLAGFYSRYDSSEVGAPLARFEGREWGAGLDLLYNLLQYGELFVDLEAGTRFEHAEVDEQIPLPGTGSAAFVLPQVGLRAVRVAPIAAFDLSTYFEWNAPNLAGTDEDELEFLGRLFASDDFAVLHWDHDLSFYLEPLIDPRGWYDPRTPADSTLAHEVALSVRGQWALGYRLVPQYQSVLGGLYSVRGYEQSVVAGDTAVIASGEYRFHLPRIFFPDPTPSRVPLIGELRTRPPHVYGMPDWDLIFRTFLDIGYAEDSHALVFERPVTLVGSGAGLELQILRNFSARFDVGVPLKSARKLASAGSPEFYFAATLLY